MDDGAMANSHVIADNARILIGEVQHGVVLNVRVVADDDAIDVAAKDRVIPDAGIIPNRYVTHYDCALSDVNASAKSRLFQQKSFKLLDHICHRNRLKQEPAKWSRVQIRCRKQIVLVLLLVLDWPIFDYENEDDDEDESFARIAAGARDLSRT